VIHFTVSPNPKTKAIIYNQYTHVYLQIYICEENIYVYIIQLSGKSKLKREIEHEAYHLYFKRTVYKYRDIKDDLKCSVTG